MDDDILLFIGNPYVAGWGGTMRNVHMSLAILLLFSAMCAAGQRQEQRGPSTLEERERFVSITRKLETNPLDPALALEREWAIVWLKEVPDIRAKVCGDELGTAYTEEKYRHAHEITIQLQLSSGAFVIENPDKAKDDKALYQAAIEGVLKAYQAILKQEPGSKSKSLNELLQKQNEGKLASFVRDLLKKCK
jgi:hypothetical protein